MACHVVLVVYDHTTKATLRWYVLDNEGQLSDPAFRPTGPKERVLRVPLQLYKALAGNDPSKPLLYKLQDYVNGNAP